MNLLFLLCVFTVSAPPPQFASVFGKDYTRAVSFYQSHMQECKSLADFYQQDNALMTAVVFPEWIRYSYFKDFFETEALELAYIEYGSSAADFSVGYCQMKPSFVEQIETEILNNKLHLQKYEKLIPSGTITEQRKKRLENLQSLQMQWTYLACFQEIVKQKFPASDDFFPEEKVKFYATVYNAGWQKSMDGILKQMHIASYPYGSHYPASLQYVYAEVALDFYLNVK